MRKIRVALVNGNKTAKTILDTMLKYYDDIWSKMWNISKDSENYEIH